MPRGWCAGVVTLLVALAAAASAGAAPRAVEEFSVPTAASQPSAIAAGPDGAAWFTEKAANKIGRITTAGAITEFTIPAAGSEPTAIAAGPDGNIWFTESAGNAVARITPAGVITQFTVPTASSNPSGISGGADGNVWFTEKAASKIARITPSGTITEFSTLFASDGPTGISPGPVDGGEAIWFVGTTGNHVGFQGLTSGVSGETTIPTPSSTPLGIAQGSDGAAWFTESAVATVGRISFLFSSITEFPLPDGSPAGITSGSDGALWLTIPAVSHIVRFTTAGVETDSVATPTAKSEPLGITAGTEGTIWFTEKAGNKIGRITLPALPTGPVGPSGSAGAAGPPGPPGPPGASAPITVVAFKASVSRSKVTVSYVLTGAASVALQVKPPKGAAFTAATASGHRGVNTLSWNRKLRGKRARKGSYKLSVVVKAGAVQASSALSARLR
jgi:streptogramin lyase